VLIIIRAMRQAPLDNWPFDLCSNVRVYFPSPEHTQKIKRNNLQTRVESGFGLGGGGLVDL
jgi:hypothetical protein